MEFLGVARLKCAVKAIFRPLRGIPVTRNALIPPDGSLHCHRFGALRRMGARLRAAGEAEESGRMGNRTKSGTAIRRDGLLASITPNVRALGAGAGRRALTPGSRPSRLHCLAVGSP